MANAEELIINLKAVMDINDVRNNVNQVQNVLSKLKLPPDLQRSFSSTFADIGKTIDAIEQKMKNGFKTKSDVSTLEKDFNKVDTLYEKIMAYINKIQDEDIKASITFDTKPIKEAEERIEELKNAIQSKISTATGIDDIVLKVKELQKEAGTSSKAWGNFANALQSGDLAGASNQLQNIISNMNSFKADAEKLSVVGVDVKKSIEEINAAIAAGKFEEASQKLKDFNEVIELNKTAFSNDGKNILAYAEQSKQLIAILQKASNVDISTLSTELKQMGINLEGLKVDQIKQFYETFYKVKPAIEQSKQSLGDFAQRTAETVSQTQNLDQQLGQLSSRVASFVSLSNAVNLFKRALREAFNTVKELDAAMTETAVVTDFSVGDMWEKLPEYTAVANQFGSTIKDAYDVMTIFYQQGLNTNEAFSLGTQTMQMARIAGLDYANAADKMTNALRGFNMELNETSAQKVNDVYSELAAISASDTRELATAMTKVASLANSANMEFENTAAFLAQMIETTRESAETAGTALKTVVARFAEVKELYSEGDLVGNVDGEEININKVGEALRAAGIDLNEFMTGAKGLDDILLELSGKWDSLDLLTQRYIATMAAGSRQQSRFLALMSDNARLTELTGAAYNAQGASSKQFAKTEESLATALNRLSNSWDTFLMGIEDSTVIKGFINAINEVLTVINNITQKLPPAGTAIANLALSFGAIKVAGKALTGVIGKVGGPLVNLFSKGAVEGQKANGIFSATGKIFGEIKQKIANFQLGKGFLTDAQLMQQQALRTDATIKILNADIEKPVTSGSLIAFSEIGEGSVKAAITVEGSGEIIEGELSEVGAAALLTGEDLDTSLSEGAEVAQIGVNSALELIEKELEELQLEIAKTEAKLKQLKEEGDLTSAGIEGKIYTEDGLNSTLKAQREAEEALLRDKKYLNSIPNTPKYNKIGNAIGNSKMGQGITKLGDKIGGVIKPLGTLSSNIATKLAPSLGAAGSAAIGAAASLGIVAAAIGTVIVASVAVYKAIKADENRLKSLQASSEDMIKTAEKTGSALDNLNQAWEQLGEDNHTLDSLVKGTTEWYNQLLKVNQEVVDIYEQLEAYGLTDNIDLKVDQNGQLSIAEKDYKEASESLEAMYKNQISQAQIMSNIASYEQNKKDNEDEYKENIKSLKEEARGRTATGGRIGGLAAEPTANEVLEEKIKVENTKKELEDKRDKSIAVTKQSAALKTQYEDSYSDNAYKIAAELSMENEEADFKKMKEKAAKESGTLKYSSALETIFGNYEKGDQQLEEWAQAHGYVWKAGDLYDGETKIDYKSKDATKEILDYAASGLYNKEKIKNSYLAAAQSITSKLGKENPLLDLLANNGTMDLSKDIDISKLYNENIFTDEIIQQLGFSDREAMVTELINRIGEIQQTQNQQIADNIGNLAEMYATTNSDISWEGLEDKIKNFSAEASAAFADQLATISSYNNQKLSDAYVDYINTVGEGFKELDTSSLVAISKNQNFEGIFSEAEILQSLFTDGTISGLDEQIKDLIEDNDKITPDNIKELAKTSDELSDYIKDNEERVIGLANSLTYIEQGVLTFEDLTDNVLASVSACQTLDSHLLSMNEHIENFDTGGSFLAGYEFYSDAIDAMDELAEKEAYGDQQFTSYIKDVFAKANLEGNEDVKEYQKLMASWSKQNGKGFWDMISKGDSNISATDESWLNNLTTDEAIKQVIQASRNAGHEVTEQYARAQLLNYLGHSVEGANALRENDTKKSFQNLVDTADGKRVILNSEEISTNAKTLGLTDEEYKDQIDKYNGLAKKITDFYNDKKDNEGYIEADLLEDKANELDVSLDELINKILILKNNGNIEIEIGVDFSTEDGKSTLTSEQIRNASLSGAYIDENGERKNWEGQTLNGSFITQFHDDKTINIDYTNLISQMKELNYTAEMQQQVLSAWEDKLADSSGYFTQVIKTLNEKGEWVDQTITGKTVTELKDNIEQAQKEADYTLMGTKIAESLGQIQVNINGETLSEETKKAVTNNGEGWGIKVAVDKPEEITTKITTAIDGADGKTITIKANVVPSENGSNTSSENSQGSGAFGTPLQHSKVRTQKINSYARGGATKNETALVGENAPELIQFESGGAYLAGTEGPEMIDLHKGDIVYPGNETQEIFKRGGLNSLLSRYANGTGPSYNRYAEVGWGPENSGDGKDNKEATEENTEALESLSNQLSTLKEGGIWTTPAQLILLEKQRKLLYEEYGIQKKTLASRLKEAGILKDTDKRWVGLLEKISDGTFTMGDFFGAIKEEASSIKDIDFKSLFTTPKDIIEEIKNDNGFGGATKELDDDFWSKLDEINDAEFEIFSEWIDKGTELAGKGIDIGSQLTDSAIQMIEAFAQAAVDGFNSYLGWMTMKIDDEHDIEQLDSSLSNIVDRLAWEYDKLLKRRVGYDGTDTLNEKELFENSNQSAKNIMARMQNQRRLYENSFRQLEDLGLNISSELTEAFEKLYDQLYGANGPFTRLNKSINRFKGQLEDVFPSTSKFLGEAKGIVGNLFQDGKEKIDGIFEKIFPSSIFNDLIDNFTIDGYQLGDFGKEKMQKLIELFTELTPSFNADYQIANKSELVDALNQKMSTIITNDTITAQFVQGYLDYLTEVESQMESEVENIRNSESQILELYDNLTEILERGKEEYSELGQDLYTAITDEKNSLLEELQALHDSITAADEDILNTLRSNLELIRQQRENDKTEQDLQAKEARLAYLRQDTTGANLQEIKKLEKELEDGQESYTDKLIDQKISELEKQNTDAADQRQIQIDLLQEEINNTEGIWETVEKLLSGISKFDHYLTGEIDREGYKAVIEQLKKGQSYLDSSSTDKEQSEKDWDAKIRAASLYRQVKDNLSDEYNYLKLASNIIDRETGLPEEYVANGGWNNYVAFSTLETTVDKSNQLLQEAITAVNNLVEKITVSYDDEQSLHMKATYYGGLVQAVSGTESAAKAAIEDIASGAPEILNQLTEGTGNMAKGFLKLGLSVADTSWAAIVTAIKSNFATGGGAASTSLGNMGEGLGFLMEGISNYVSAAADAASLGMQMAGDMAPGITDIGVALATALKETFFNDYEKVEDDLIENIDVIVDKLGNTLGTSGYLKEIKDAIKLSEKIRLGQPDDENSPIYDALTEMYQDLLKDYRQLENNENSKTDVEGYNKLYLKATKLREMLNGMVNYSNGFTEEVNELDPAASLETLQKWRGEIGSLFKQIDETVRGNIISIVNGIMAMEGKTLGESKISRWIDIYDGVMMSDVSTQTLQRLAVAMEEFEPELSNKLYKLYNDRWTAENTPQETFFSFWSNKVTGIWGDVQDFFDGFWNKITQSFQTVVESITGKNYDDSWIGKAGKNISDFIDDLKTGDFWKGIGNRISDFFDQSDNKLVIWLKNIFDILSAWANDSDWKTDIDWTMSYQESKVMNTAAQEKLGHNFKWNTFSAWKNVDDNIIKKFSEKSEDNKEKIIDFLEELSRNLDIYNKLDSKGIVTSLRDYYGINSFATGGSIRRSQTALVGEAGTELIQHARGGATLATSPSMTKLEKGDVVYNAKQTKDILKGGGLDFSRFAEGTVSNFMLREPSFGYSALKINFPDFSETNKENNFNLNLKLEDLTVDSVDRVEEVAERVMDKINATVSGAMWPYNRL